MQLSDILKEVREENLSKGQLENYEQKLAALYAEMMLEIAEKKKAEAMFFLARSSPEVSDVSIKRAWRGTPEGQRLIELEAYVKATAKMLSSIKSRIYQSPY